MSEGLSQEEILARKFEGREEKKAADKPTPSSPDIENLEGLDPEQLAWHQLLINLREAHDLEIAHKKAEREGQRSKWSPGESPGERSDQFVEKHGGKVQPRTSRHTGKGNATRGTNYKDWVPDIKRARRRAHEGDIEEALVDRATERTNDNPHEPDWTPEEWGVIWHVLKEPGWELILDEINHEIDNERGMNSRTQDQSSRGSTGERELSFSELKELKRLEEESRKVRHFGRDRFR